MIRTVPMIRADDGKTADVYPDEVENWRPHGWEIDEARVQAQAEEAARLKREAEEKARAEAERKVAEEDAMRKAEEDAAAAARQAQADGAPAAQEGQGGAAPERAESEDIAAPERAGSGKQETPPDAAAAGQGTGPAESAAGAPVSAEGGDGASSAEARSLSVGKGPKGLWFVKAEGAIVSPGFSTEEAAAAALAEIAAGDQK
jgi:hypothetical protein